MQGNALLDNWVVAAVFAKAFGYLLSLQAIGGVFFLIAFPEAPEGTRRFVRRLSLFAATSLIFVVLFRFGIRSGRISGMGLPGMADPMMLGFVWQSPFGNSALCRGIGAVLVFIGLMRQRIITIAALAGAMLIAISYSLIGHALHEPRFLLAISIVMHFLAVSFWVGSLAPLFHMASEPKAAQLLHRFGTLAGWAVAVLALAGAFFLSRMSPDLRDMFRTAYGAVFIVKLFFVILLLGLAGWNKWRLVPALARGDKGAATSLRRSISLEVGVIICISIATAALTSVTVPPVNL